MELLRDFINRIRELVSKFNYSYKWEEGLLCFYNLINKDKKEDVRYIIKRS